jgi:hypothetical protein
MSELARESLAQRVRAGLYTDGRTERSEGLR